MERSAIGVRPGGLGVVGSNPAAPTKNLSEINGPAFRSSRAPETIRERNGPLEPRGTQKVPRKSHAMMLVCSLFGFLCMASESPAQQLEPIVGRASVIDGDTIEIRGQRIRIQAIDAPESGQWCGEGDGRWRCGKASAEALDRMLDGATVTCRQDPRDPQDRYKRVLARCEARGADVGEALLHAGLAVAYVKYLDYRNGEPRPYKAGALAAEAKARAAKRGLWAGVFDFPWDWRAARRGTR